MLFALGGICLTGCAGAKQHQMGKSLMDAGDYDRAVTLLREAVAEDPANGEYFDRLSDALTRAADFHFDQAKTLHTQHRPGEAAKELAIALDYMPGHPGAITLVRTVQHDVAVCSRWRQQAEEAVAREDWDEALRLADQARGADQGDANTAALYERTRSAVISRHLALAQLALEAGDREKCLDECARVKLCDASNPFVAQIEHKLGRTGRSPSETVVAPTSQPVARNLIAIAAPRMPVPPAAAPAALTVPAGTVAIAANQPTAPAVDTAARHGEAPVVAALPESTRTRDVPAADTLPPRASTPAPAARSAEVIAAPLRVRPSLKSASPDALPAEPPTRSAAIPSSKPKPAARRPLIEVREPASGRLLARSPDPMHGVGGDPPEAMPQRDDLPRESDAASDEVRPVVPREATLPGATFFTKPTPAAQPVVTTTRPATTQPEVVSGYVIIAPTQVAPPDLTPARTPQPVAGRIVTARPKGLIQPRAEQRPGSPRRLFRGTVSRDDDRYDHTLVTVDGIEVSVRDTDESPLDADLEIRAGNFHVEPDDLPVGAGIRVRGVSGRAYRLVIIWIDDHDETVHFAIDTLD